MAKTTSSSKAADWVTDRMLRAMIAALRRRPYAERIARFGRITAKAIGPLSGYTKRAENNLARIYPEMSATERRALADAVCDNFGRSFMEFQSFREFTDHAAALPPVGPGLPVLAEAAAAKRPVILAGAHFGNPEAPRHALSALGYEIGSLYRPMTNPYFNELYVGALESLGAPCFAQGRQGTMAFVKHLKRGGMATLYFDVSAGHERLPFLGHKAKTAISLAEIALRVDAIVIPVFGIRQDDGVSFQIEVEAPIPHTTPVEMILALNARLEAQIARHPSQWFWVHRRWKDGGQP
ncbi:lysophospholipid acyltransferase family protein [Yoonia litorea]|uniref:KDO2-lipid IV(A) lauroyltransferase n=1 Tax=Yoonia litorea TaxID=1123755 RepID=A0A1I6LVR2_9RHOB|nr:lysophospholipid acyltransferase family protein [Yoonia litorea]SFS07508.1 KDO2-lipid IV(A) lauroyltransferase [Yoonia litorea]